MDEVQEILLTPAVEWENRWARLRKPYNFPVARTHRPYIGAIEIADMHLQEPDFAFPTFFPL